MQTTWVIAADSSRARIFEMSDEDAERFEEIDDLVNPEGRQDDREQRTDAKGRFFGKGKREQGHTAEPHVGVIEHSVEMFSKQLGHYLDQARNEHRFDKLCLIAPPKFLGLIRQNLGEEAKKAVEEEIPKDLAWIADHDIEAYVRQRPH